MYLCGFSFSTGSSCSADFFTSFLALLCPWFSLSVTVRLEISVRVILEGFFGFECLESKCSKNRAKCLFLYRFNFWLPGPISSKNRQFFYVLSITKSLVKNPNLVTLLLIRSANFDSSQRTDYFRVETCCDANIYDFII